MLYLSSVAIPGKVLATKAISVQRLSFTVFLYPLGRAEALRLFQKRCLSSEGGDIAVNVFPHVTLGSHPGAAGVVVIVDTAGLAEPGTGTVYSIDRHAGVFNEKVFHRTRLHLDSG